MKPNNSSTCSEYHSTSVSYSTALANWQLGGSGTDILQSDLGTVGENFTRLKSMSKCICIHIDPSRLLQLKVQSSNSANLGKYTNWKLKQRCVVFAPSGHRMYCSPFPHRLTQATDDRKHWLFARSDFIHGGFKKNNSDKWWSFWTHASWIARWLKV